MPRTVALHVLAPNPEPTHRLDDPDVAGAARRLDCRAYDRCLAVAAGRHWRGFHCRACPAYVPQTASERHRDLLAMLELLAATEVLVRVPSHHPRCREDVSRSAGPFLRDADDTMPLPLAT